jgi:hypothetical protein
MASLLLANCALWLREASIVQVLRYLSALSRACLSNQHHCLMSLLSSYDRISLLEDRQFTPALLVLPRSPHSMWWPLL